MQRALAPEYRRPILPATLARAGAGDSRHVVTAPPLGGYLTPASLLRLQHHHGNQFVLRLLAEAASQPRVVPALTQIQRMPVKEVTVSGKTMDRLRLAQQAIQQVNNEILKFGAGNQTADIRKTKGVSLHRTKVLAEKKDVDWKVTRNNAEDEKKV